MKLRMPATYQMKRREMKDKKKERKERGEGFSAVVFSDDENPNLTPENLCEIFISSNREKQRNAKANNLAF